MPRVKKIDGVNYGLEHTEPAPRCKRRKVAAGLETKFQMPCDATIPARKAGEKKAKVNAQTGKPLPSSPSIPRKRGRSAAWETQPSISTPSVTNSDGQALGESQIIGAIGQGRVDQANAEFQMSDVNAAILHIVQLWRMRQRWHKAEKSLILQAKAICRAFSGGDKDEANKAFDAAMKGGDVSVEISAALLPFLPSITKFEEDRKAIEKDLKKTAKSIPTYEWAKSIRGFGELNFAALIGESSVIEEDGSVRGPGDYRTVSALWKRLGLGLVNGERQRRVSDAELAILHGYNPARRSVVFNVGECLIKAGGDYKFIYDDRKAYELARDPEIRPIHAHRRASRYMTKRLVRKLFAQWRLETRGVSGDPDDIVLMAAE